MLFWFGVRRRFRKKRRVNGRLSLFAVKSIRNRWYNLEGRQKRVPEIDRESTYRECSTLPMYLRQSGISTTVRPIVPAKRNN